MGTSLRVVVDVDVGEANEIDKAHGVEVKVITVMRVMGWLEG